MKSVISGFIENCLSMLIIAGILFCLAIPIILTILNIANLLKKKKSCPNPIDAATFILGIPLTIIFWWYCDFKEYHEALRLGGFEVPFHSPIALWSMPTIITFCIIAIISYILVRVKKLDLPPLIAIIAMSGNFIGIVLSIIFIIQLSCNLPEYIEGMFYFTILPLNYILCSIRAEIELIKNYKEKQKSEDYNCKILNNCNKILMKMNIEKWPIIAIIFSIPIALFSIGVLVLFGQRPDEIIRAFTETSDWTLSQKISPPSVTYDAHYLCTVSLRGHKNVVKPLRYGIRRNEKIVVNRQLCIANAFEQLIEEKTPRFHKFIRHVYDKYGYPISKHINTPIQADITYILMKPLEWIFLIVLYLFDKKPENRIAMQYLPKKIKV